MLKYRILPVTPYQQNCTLFWCDQTAEAAIVDPGGDLERLLALIDKSGVTLVKILLTHGHLDHVGAAGPLAALVGVPILGPHPDDAFLLHGLPGQCATFGFPPIEAFTPSQWLESGDKIALGNSQFEVLHCPGHTPGHVVFYSAADRLAQVGDVIFQGSIDLLEAFPLQEGAVIASSSNCLFSLGDDLRFIPGHGPMSTIGDERRYNPFVGDSVMHRANRI